MNDKSRFPRKSTLSALLILLLLLITAASVGITIWSLFFRETDDILSPDYAPLETEKHAQVLPDDGGSKLESPAGGGAVSLTYSNQVSIDIRSKTASLFFANPGKSNQDIVVQIVIQGEVIVQSGTITPGHRVMQLDLLEGAEKKLVPGGYDGKFVILYYNRDDGEKAIVNTEIPIQITVTE